MSRVFHQLRAGQLPPDTPGGREEMAMCKTGSKAVRLLHILHGAPFASDKQKSRQRKTNYGAGMSTSWAFEVKAVAVEEPSRLVQILTGAILGCGGWVLSRGANDTGLINMLFEFERRACVDVYSMLIAAGLELSQIGHVRFTELCQCTRNHPRNCGAEIASIDLEIQTFPVETARQPPAMGGI